MQRSAGGRALAVLFLVAGPAYASGSLLAGLRHRVRTVGVGPSGDSSEGEDTSAGALGDAGSPGAPMTVTAQASDSSAQASNSSAQASNRSVRASNRSARASNRSVQTSNRSARADGAALTAVVLAGAGAGVLAAATILIPQLAAWTIFFGSAAALTLVGIWEGRAPATQEREESMDGPMGGNVVLVTGVGAPGQMGYALAQAFQAAGWQVAITGRSAELEDTHANARMLAGLGSQVLGVAGDLTRDDHAARIVEAVRARFDRLDVLVNAAGGLSVIKPLVETTTQEWEREVARNAETAFVMSRAALPLLRERRGAIVNFASPAGFRAAARLGAYSAGKAAVVALTRALALEEKQNGVRVNAVAPGMIDTEANREAVEDPAKVAWVTREEIARVVLFLASEASSGISGETIPVLGQGLS